VAKSRRWFKITGNVRVVQIGFRAMLGSFSQPVLLARGGGQNEGPTVWLDGAGQPLDNQLPNYMGSTNSKILQTRSLQIFRCCRQFNSAFNMDRLHWRSLLAESPATVTCDSYATVTTVLGFATLGSATKIKTILSEL
jgi:hypothetical protein